MATKPPENKELDAKVLARRQKDLEGFLEKYQNIIDNRVKAYAAEITPFWRKALARIREEIKLIYAEIQDANGVPIIKEPIQPAKYRNMKRQLERLAMLQQQIISLLSDDSQEEKLTRSLAYQYTESYYFHAFGMEQAARVAINVPALTESYVMGVLANPWLPDGKTYGNRIRSNTQYLAEKMEVALEEALSKGWSVNRTARHIQETANEGFYNAVRLARTELNRAAAQGANHSYMQNADILDGKRWNATLDARTAPKDAQNDGKVFELSYDTPENPGKAGQRIPNHPNCRCKWTPILSALGISTKERIARGEGDSKTEFGERIYTNARTYKEYAKERGLPDLSEKLRNDKPSSYLRRGEKVYNESNKRNIPLLPNFDRAVIPEAKLLGYALNKDHPTGKDKAAAFEKALGYTSANYIDLIKNVRDNLDKFPAESKGSNDYGERYQAILSLTGPNGKTANVLTAWIIRTNEELPQLTTIHVDKKKGAKDNDS